MAEEPKDPPQGESMTSSDTTADSTHGSERKDSGSAEQVEAAVAPATSGTKSIEPQDETFWEESVDASAVNLADAGTAQEKKEAERAAEDTPESGNAPPEISEENTTGEETKEATPDETTVEEQGVSAESETPGENSAPADQEAGQPAPENESPPVMDSDTEIVAKKEEATPDKSTPEEQGMSAESETPREQSAAADEDTAQLTPEDEPPQVEKSVKDTVTEKTEALDVSGEEGTADVTAEGEDQQPQESELEILAETETQGEESTPEKTGEEDNSEEKAPALEKEEGQQKEEAVSPADPAEAAAEATKISWYSSRKAMMIAAGIVLLIIASIGYTVVPFFRSDDTALSTFLRGKPENAYDMKFFLPLNVGYNEARFVKVTIAIELMDKGFKKEIDKNVSQLRQEVIDLLLTKSPQEVKSSKGKKLLRQEITSRLNQHFARDCIKDTYFTELVIL